MSGFYLYYVTWKLPTIIWIMVRDERFTEFPHSEMIPVSFRELYPSVTTLKGPAKWLPRLLSTLFSWHSPQKRPQLCCTSTTCVLWSFVHTFVRWYVFFYYYYSSRLDNEGGESGKSRQQQHRSLWVESQSSIRPIAIYYFSKVLRWTAANSAKTTTHRRLTKTA